MEHIKLKSRAKINLTLDVVGKRADNYHNLSMIMQTLSLHDSIYIKKIEKRRITLKSNLAYLPSDSRNIAYKAAQVMIDKFKIDQGVYIEITKRIPVAAGLAGGSGNCAAVLKGMNELFELNLSLEELMEIGASIGSDVPYCIIEGTALAEGRGEVLTSIKECPDFYVVLAKPDTRVSTAAVYGNLVLEKIEKHPNTGKMVLAIENKDKDILCQELCNVLETVTITQKPIVGRIKKYMLEQGASGALMSGSGPTVFALFDSEEKAELVAENTRKRFGLKDVILTKIENH